MSSSRNKLLIAADNPTASTGYGKVARYLALHMKELGYEVAFAGLQYFGEPATLLLDNQPFTMYEGATPGGLVQAIERFRPHFVLHIRDNWVFTRYSSGKPYDIFTPCRQYGAKLILYSPVQSEPLPREVLKVMTYNCDFNLTMCKWSRDVLLKQGLPKEKVDYLYHGVDVSKYRPIDRALARDKIGLETKAPLVGYIAMNYDYRKMIPLAMKAFKHLLEYLPDAEMLLWTERVAYWDLAAWQESLGLQKKIYWPKATKTSGIEENLMPYVINSLDCLLHSSAAEGFGLPLLEAMACGVPVVCAPHPVLKEVLRNYPYYCEAWQLLPTVWGSFEYLVNPEDMAKQALTAIKAGRKPVPRWIDDYDWRKIARELDDILEGL